MKIFKLGQTQQTYHQLSRKHHPLRPQPSVFLSLTCLTIYISSSRFLQTLSNSLTPGHRRWKTYPHPSFAPLHHLLTSFSQPSISPDSLPFHVRDTQDPDLSSVTQCTSYTDKFQTQMPSGTRTVRQQENTDST